MGQNLAYTVLFVLQPCSPHISWSQAGVKGTTISINSKLWDECKVMLCPHMYTHGVCFQYSLRV